jgi:hypothetical protein
VKSVLNNIHPCHFEQRREIFAEGNGREEVKERLNATEVARFLRLASE